MIFKAKKDLLYRIVFYISFGLLFYATYSTIQEREWIATVVMILLLCFLASIWFGTTYTINEQTLIIRSGPFKQTINITDITNVRKMKNPFASAALAMKRLEINNRHYNTVQISPVEATNFINELQKIQPEIKVID